MQSSISPLGAFRRVQSEAPPWWTVPEQAAWVRPEQCTCPHNWLERCCTLKTRLNSGFGWSDVVGGWQHPHGGFRVPGLFYIVPGEGGSLGRTLRPGLPSQACAPCMRHSWTATVVSGVHDVVVSCNCEQMYRHTLLFQALKTGCCVFSRNSNQHQQCLLLKGTPTALTDTREDFEVSRATEN